LKKPLTKYKVLKTLSIKKKDKELTHGSTSFNKNYDSDRERDLKNLILGSKGMTLGLCYLDQTPKTLSSQ